MTNKLEMPLEQFAEAVAKENERLQSQYDIALGAIRVGIERIEQLTSGPGGIMEMKQTIANKERRIEKLEAALRQIEHENTFTSKLAKELGHKCGPFATIARKALEGKELLQWTENYGQGSEPWLKDVKDEQA